MTNGAGDPDEVSIWTIRDPEREPTTPLERGLTDDERLHAAGYRDEAARRRFVATRIALRDILARETGCDPGSIRIDGDHNGKPVADHPAGLPVPHFNVAHTRGLALVALHPTREVGIDVEPVTAVAEAAVRSRVCTPEESAELEALDPGERAARFVRLWVRKEAAAKADGRGMRLTFSRIDVIGTGPVDIEGRAELPTIYVRDIDVGSGHLAAVASVGQLQTWSLRRWDAPARRPLGG
jgi:4'-phosphopantetheinyl transferase